MTIASRLRRRPSRAQAKLHQQSNHHKQHPRAERERPVNTDARTGKSDGDAAEHAHAHREHAEHADRAAAHLGRRIELHQRLRHRVEREFDEAGDEEDGQRERIARRKREAGQRQTPDHREYAGGARARLQQAAAFEDETGGQCTGCVGAEQHAVEEVCILLAEIVGEPGHLRLVGVADE